MKQKNDFTRLKSCLRKSRKVVSCVLYVDLWLTLHAELIRYVFIFHNFDFSLLIKLLIAGELFGLHGSSST